MSAIVKDRAVLGVPVRCFRFARAFTFWRFSPAWLVACLILLASPLRAQTFEPSFTVGAGIQTDYQHSQTGSVPDDQFSLGHARIYLGGDITPNISAMFNTDYSTSSNTLGILDAVAQFHTKSPMFNVWFGRFLPPSDRDNFTGPFYANEWDMFTDGIQDGYPSVFQGRDNGIAYWGDFKAGMVKMKASVGVFDGSSVDGDKNVLWAGRLQFDFWDPENGYYLNSTYYGDKNLIAIAVASQAQADATGSATASATTVDFLLEKKVLNGGAFTVESEFSDYNGLGGYYSGYGNSSGTYGLVSFLEPKVAGIGKFEFLGKYAIAEATHGAFIVDEHGARFQSFRQDTTEVDVDYIIKQFDARLMSFYRDTRFNDVNLDSWAAGIGLQIQLSKTIK
jgi:hypothetical protein